MCKLSFNQPSLIGSWYEGNPCNMHLLSLGKKVKEGVIKAGLIGYQFNTIGVRYSSCKNYCVLIKKVMESPWEQQECVIVFRVAKS